MNIADDTPTGDESKNTSPPLVVVTLDIPPGVELSLTVNGVELVLDD
jgi:hypothetical protein